MLLPVHHRLPDSLTDSMQIQLSHPHSHVWWYTITLYLPILQAANCVLNLSLFQFIQYVYGFETVIKNETSSHHNHSLGRLNSWIFIFAQNPTIKLNLVPLGISKGRFLCLFSIQSETKSLVQLVISWNIEDSRIFVFMKTISHLTI